MANKLAEALAKKIVKSEENEENDAYGDSAEELFESIKKGDSKSFKETLRAVMEILKNE